MHTKRILIMLLVVVLTIICGATAVAAQDNANGLSIAAEVTSSAAVKAEPCAVKPGDSVDVSVMITKNSGIKGIFEFVLGYDEAALEPTVTDGNVVYTSGKLFGASQEILLPVEGESGKLQYRVNATGLAEAMKTEGKAIITITFKVKDTFHGNTGITVSGCYAVDPSTYDLTTASVSDANTSGYNKATISTHKYGAAKTADATCTTPATSTYTCSVEGCADKTLVIETAPAKGHTPGAAATCKAAQTCTVCNAEITAKLETHTPGAAATCTTAQKCTVCDKELEAAKGHTPGAEATCTTPQTCTVCNAELMAAPGHTPVTVEGTDATCTEAGLTDGQKCSVCNEVLEEQTEIPATGHTYGDWQLKEEATRKAEGIEERVCSACGHTEQRTVPFDGMSTAAIVIIILAIVLVLGVGGFCLYWFVIRKKLNA
ncbi:MAG: hypothetical protein IJY08_04160 [Clostridia bacterium]|nr:hypothetical protein [Clostridia bacterium]